MFDENRGGAVEQAHRGLAGDPDVPAVMGGLVEPHPRERSHGERGGQVPDRHSERRVLLRGQRLECCDQCEVVLEELGTLLGRLHRVPAVPHLTVEAVIGCVALAQSGEQTGESDLRAAAEVRQDGGDRPLAGSGGTRELVRVERWKEGCQSVVLVAEGVDRTPGKGGHDGPTPVLVAMFPQER